MKYKDQNGLQGNRPTVEAGLVGGGVNKWRRKDLTNKGEPIGVYMGASDVEGGGRGATYPRITH